MHALINDSAFTVKHLHYSNTITSSSSTPLLLGGYGNGYLISRLEIHNDHDDGDLVNLVIDEKSKSPQAMFVESHCNGIFSVSLAPFCGILQST